VPVAEQLSSHGERFVVERLRAFQVTHGMQAESEVVYDVGDVRMFRAE